MNGSRSRTVLVVLFAVYLVLLVWLVLWKLEVPWVGDDGRRVVKLVPFVPGDGTGASRPIEVVANLLLFVPFGVYLRLLAPSWSWWRAAGVFAGASLGLEIAQYVLAVGSSDVTDVIVNTGGGLAGLGLIAGARRRHATRTVSVIVRACSIGTVLALVASGVVAASPLRYGAPGTGPGLDRTLPAQRVERGD
ncbi:VanZ family protein [Agromyces sp. NPDC004153]